MEKYRQNEKKNLHAHWLSYVTRPGSANELSDVEKLGLGYYKAYTWLIQAGRAVTGGMVDTGTVAYTGRHGGY